MNDGELWTRFTKVYPATARKYEQSGGGKPLQDPDLIAFLDGAVPRQFPGHNANVTKMWLPTDLEKRKEYIAMATKNWAEEDKRKSKTSRLETIKTLYKTTTREKWAK